MEKFQCDGRLKRVKGVLAYKTPHTCSDVGRCELMKAIGDFFTHILTHPSEPVKAIYVFHQKKFDHLGLNVNFPSFQEMQATFSYLDFREPKETPAPSTSRVVPPLNANPATPVQENGPEDTSPVGVTWTSHMTDMSAVMPCLLDEEKFVDVTLACDGKFIKCHKVILGACSPYLDELLSANPCQHPIILLRDLQFWELQAIVDFIYRGAVNVPQHRLSRLLQTANVLQIKGLTRTNDEAASKENEVICIDDGVESETEVSSIVRKRSPSPVILQLEKRQVGVPVKIVKITKNSSQKSLTQHSRKQKRNKSGDVEPLSQAPPEPPGRLLHLIRKKKEMREVDEPPVNPSRYHLRKGKYHFYKRKQGRSNPLLPFLKRSKLEVAKPRPRRASADCPEPSSLLQLELKEEMRELDDSPGCSSTDDQSIDKDDCSKLGQFNLVMLPAIKQEVNEDVSDDVDGDPLDMQPGVS